MSYNNISSNVKLRQSTVDNRSLINDRGDKVTYLGNNHAIVNGDHVYGRTSIGNAIKNLFSK